MDEDREKGRIIALKVRREKAAAFARTMVPILNEARRDLTGGIHSGISLRGYADWLNQRDFKTGNGKVWRAETVSRLLDAYKSLRQQANEEYDRSEAMLDFRHKRLTKADRIKARPAHDQAVADLASERDRQIAEAEALGLALVGK